MQNADDKTSIKLKRILVKISYKFFIAVVVLGLFGYFGTRIIPDFKKDYELQLESSQAYQVEVLIVDSKNPSIKPMYLCLVSDNKINTMNIKKTISTQTSLVISSNLTYTTNDNCEKTVDYITIPLKY